MFKSAFLVLICFLARNADALAGSSGNCVVPKTPRFGSSSCDEIRGTLQCSGSCHSVFTSGEEIVVLRCNMTSGEWLDDKDSFPECVGQNCSLNGCENGGSCDALSGYCLCSQDFRGGSCQYSMDLCEEAWTGVSNSTVVSCEHLDGYSECSIRCLDTFELTSAAASQYRCREDGQIIWTNGDRESCQPAKNVVTCSIGSYGGLHVRSIDNSWFAIASFAPFVALSSTDSNFHFNVSVVFDQAACAIWLVGRRKTCDRNVTMAIQLGSVAQSILVQISNGLPRIVADPQSNSYPADDVRITQENGWLTISVGTLIRLSFNNYDLSIETTGGAIRTGQGLCAARTRTSMLANSQDASDSYQRDSPQVFHSCSSTALSSELYLDIRNSYSKLFTAFEHCSNRITPYQYTENLEYDYCLAYNQAKLSGLDQVGFLAAARCATFRHFVTDTQFIGCASRSDVFNRTLLECNNLVVESLLGVDDLSSVSAFAALLLTLLSLW